MASFVPPSLKPASVGDKQYYINLLSIYLPNLREKMNVESVTTHLASLRLLKLDEIRDFDDLAKSDRKSAVVKLMNKLKNSDDPEWFQKFKTALRKSGQQIIFKLMNEEDVKDEEAFEDLLLANYVAVVEAIDPMQLLPELLQRGTITQTDCEEISTEFISRGKTHAARKLLTYIHCRKNGWIVDFIYSLKEANYRQLVCLFGDKFALAKSEFSLLRAADEIAKTKPSPGANRGFGLPIREEIVGEKRPEASGKSRASSLVADCPPIHMPTKCDQGFDQPSTKGFSIPNDCNNDMAMQGITTLPKKPLFDHWTGDETEELKSIIYLKDDHQLAAERTHQDDKSSLCTFSPGQSKSYSATDRMRQQSAEYASEGRTMTDSRQSDSCNYGLQSTPSEGQDSSQRNDLSRAPSGQRLPPLSASSGQRLPSLSASANLFDSTLTQEGEMDVPVEKQRLELRGYQRELAEKGLEGKNCVIVAPTGSGKTHVALYISQYHLQSCPEEDRKILFIVPKVALVQQQRRQYQTYMSEDCKVFSVSGEKDAQMSLQEIIRKNDVIVLTPQILVNAIDSGDMDGSFSEVTLMIFDECHHAMKDHPYNNIMSRYIDIVLSRDEEKILHLPQVIGLTASPGVGKAKSDEDAIEHIVKLCANLDASDICTVRCRENLAELQRNVNVPVEAIEEVKGRAIDEFHAVISKLMSEIETKMCQRNDISKLMVEVPNIQKVLEPPTRGVEAYTQFLAQLKREVVKIYDQEIRRFFLSCQEHLDIYNNALLINADCRTIDAFEFIKDQLHDRSSGHRSSLPRNETDEWLNRLYAAKAMDLEESSRSPESANPKLKYLENLILQFYKEKQDSQGIIFCKTRYMTNALVKWIKDTPSLAFLNPHNLVGAGSTTTRATASNPVSMTHRKLDDVLKYFKGGYHKIIVSTSVAEEGLDVKSCNYVIRYEHVTNDIARVQSRGRARTYDAKFVTLAEKGRGVHEREMTNQVREDLMNRAIYLVHQMPEETVRSKVMIHQETAKKERDMAAHAKVANARWKASHSHEGDYQLRCFKCNTFGVWNTDLRTIKGSHHVVLDPDFKQQIVVESHPRPKKYDDFEKKGKILCKTCALDWGISALYKNVPVYMLKVCSFVVEDPNAVRLTYKKWKEVPFPVNELLPEDMRILPSVFLGSLLES